MHDDTSPLPGCTGFLSGRAQWLQEDRIHDAKVTLNDESRADHVQLRYSWLQWDYEPSNLCKYGGNDSEQLCISKTRIVYIDMKVSPHILVYY